MSLRCVSARIQHEIRSWIGFAPHRYGGTGFRMERRESGHCHGVAPLDIRLPIRVTTPLIASGRAQPHYLLRDSGRFRVYRSRADDERQALELLHLTNRLAVNHADRRQPPTPLPIAIIWPEKALRESDGRRLLPQLLDPSA